MPVYPCAGETRWIGHHRDQVELVDVVDGCCVAKNDEESDDSTRGYEQMCKDHDLRSFAVEDGFRRMEVWRLIGRNKCSERPRADRSITRVVVLFP
jgi:hypothetical protein